MGSRRARIRTHEINQSIKIIQFCQCLYGLVVSRHRPRYSFFKRSIYLRMNVRSILLRGTIHARANVQLQADRRSEFSRRRRAVRPCRFHQASMQEICVEAGMSPGNLYRYFPSKEAIIAGIAERDLAERPRVHGGQRGELLRRPRGLRISTWSSVALEEVGLCAEIMAESRRNPAVARMSQGIRRIPGAFHCAAQSGPSAAKSAATSTSLTWSRSCSR